MKTATVLSALAATAVHAQKSGVGGKGNTDIMGSLGQIYGDKGVPLGPAPKGCAAYEVMYARGTFEPGPFGTIVGDPLNAIVLKDMKGEDVRGYAVQYPAKRGGAEIGVEDIVKRVADKAKECPKMKFALVGYSQGGGVIQAAAPKIPTELRPNVVALVLYGAGKGAGERGPIPEDIKAKILANCAPGDNCGTPVSQTESDTAFTGHLSYNNAGTQWHPRSSKYIKDAFLGKAQGYKLELAPK